MNHDFEINDGELIKYHGGAGKITIPDGVESIGYSAFEHCMMSGVTIPEGVTSIGRFAFFLCRRLYAVSLPDGLKTIADKAFCDCANLEEITLPDSLTCIKEDAFEGCTVLEEITVFGEMFSMEEITDAYNWEEIAEDYGIDEDEICTLNEAVHDVAVSELISLLINGKSQNMYMPESFRYKLITRALKHKPENQNFLNMVKEHLPEIFENLLETEIIHFLIDNKIFTNQNIDACIRIANVNNAYEIQVILTNYKTEHIGYQENNLYL
ncbi:MAG: leucine-rich repeat domain-containing protein [Oscillospiraceae bacterium]|nr:leucine-rich repeat domain-containing protein [Oscillospiraceae bacterium]